MINYIFLYTSYFYLKLVLDIFISVYLHYYFNQLVYQLTEKSSLWVIFSNWGGKMSWIQLHADVVTRVTVCPALPWTILVYTCGTGVIINDYIHSQKCLYLDDKLYCHSSYSSVIIPGAYIFTLCNIRKSFQMQKLWQIFSAIK